MLKKESNSLIKDFVKNIIYIMFFLFISLLSGSVFFIFEDMKDDYIQIRKKMINIISEEMKENSEKIINKIKFERNITKKELYIKLKNRAQNISRIISTIKKSYSDKKTILDESKKILRDIRFTDKSGYIFIVDMKGKVLLSPEFSEIEGKNQLDFKDDLGNYVIRDEITLIKNKGEGFIQNYFKKPGYKGLFEKLSYIKGDSELGIYYGTGDYLIDHESFLKGELASYFVENYSKNIFDILIFDEKDNIIKSPSFNIEKKEAIMQNFRDKKFFLISNSFKEVDSDDFYKAVYSFSISDWNWKIFLFYDEHSINNRATLIKTGFINKLIKRSLFIFGLIIILIYFYYNFLRKIYSKYHQSFVKFHKFVNTAAENNDEIDISELNFKEFKELGISINNMLNKIRRITKELQISNYRYELALKVANIASWDFNIKERSIYLSKEISELFKIEHGFFKEYQSLKNKYIPSNEHIILTKAMHKSIKNKDSFICEHTLIRDDGKEIWVGEFGKVIFENNIPVRIIGIIQNKTEVKKKIDFLKKAREKAEKADKLKSEFLANVSHELRTPMTAIIGFSELLKYEDLSKENKSYVEIIYNSSNYLLELINDLIDISRIESGHINLKIKELNISDFCIELKSSLMPRFKEKNIGLKLECEENIIINTDIIRLRQIFINLLTNSLKFTEKGNVFLKIDRENNGIKVNVKDTGIGIPKKDQIRIFKKFTQADSSISRKYGGLGLGLAITKKLVELLGGEIKVRSKKGEGTEFTFNIKDLK